MAASLRRAQALLARWEQPLRGLATASGRQRARPAASPRAPPPQAAAAGGALQPRSEQTAPATVQGGDWTPVLHEQTGGATGLAEPLAGGAAQRPVVQGPAWR